VFAVNASSILYVKSIPRNDLVHNGANERLYGRKMKAKEIVFEGATGIPEAAKELLAVLNKRSPKNLSR
jgi:lipid-binding SYLF domain-containing protein